MNEKDPLYMRSCEEAWDTEYPCDLPAGHEGDHKNSFARDTNPPTIET